MPGDKKTGVRGDLGKAGIASLRLCSGRMLPPLPNGHCPHLAASAPWQVHVIFRPSSGSQRRVAVSGRLRGRRQILYHQKRHDILPLDGSQFDWSIRLCCGYRRLRSPLPSKARTLHPGRSVNRALSLVARFRSPQRHSPPADGYPQPRRAQGSAGRFRTNLRDGQQQVRTSSWCASAVSTASLPCKSHGIRAGVV